MAGAASAGAIDPMTGAQRVAAELGLALVAPPPARARERAIGGRA